MTCSSDTRPPVFHARLQAYLIATLSSGVSSTTTRKTRSEAFGGAASGGSAAGVSGVMPSSSAEGEVGEPSCHQGDEDRNRAVVGAALVGEVEDRRADADLADDERRGLGARDLAVAQQQHLGEIGAGRHVGGKIEVGAEQAGAEEGDLAGLMHVEAELLLLVDQRAAEERHVGRVDVAVD